MTVLVDTSAIHALVVGHDANHERASAAFEELLDVDTLVTHNYVAVESVSLMHSRYGRTGARAVTDLFGVMEFVWVERDVHDAATRELLSAGRNGPSLVDRVSFAIMEERSITRAFAYDDDFGSRGFETVG